MSPRFRDRERGAARGESGRRLLAGASCLVAVLCAAALLVQGAHAQTNPFYRGKTIHFIISSGPGGGTDTISRLVGEFLGRHLKGNPAVVMQNMPGAGGLNATDYLYNIAPRDGTYIGMLDQSVYEAQILGDKGMRADVRRMNWLGRVMSNDAVLVARESAPVKSIADAFHKTLIVSATGLSSLIRWTVLKKVTGVKFKLIVGHEGSAQAMLAMERGEVDAFSVPWPVFRAEHFDMLKKKEVRILLQTGLDKAPGLEDVPRVVDLAKTDEQRKILELFSRPARVGRSLAAPPSVPTERVAELRAAFMATMRDPGFQAKEKALKLDFDPLPGAQLQTLILSSFDYSPKLIEKAKSLAKLD